jgi:hypothetical protein
MVLKNQAQQGNFTEPLMSFLAVNILLPLATLKSAKDRKVFIFRRKKRKTKRCMPFGQINSSPPATPVNPYFAWRFLAFLAVNIFY